MKGLKLTTGADAIVIASGVTALALPPPSFGWVPESWTYGLGTPNWSDSGVVPEIDFEIWGDTAIAITGAELYGAAPHPLAFADLAVTAIDASANTLTHVAHARLTGDGPVRVNVDGTDSGGIVGTHSAKLDLGAVTPHVDTVVKAKEPSSGADGNAITVQLVGDDSSAAGTLVEDTTANTVVLHYKAGTTTVTQLETLIGTSTLIAVETAGTGATVLQAGDALAATHMAGGITGDDYWLVKVDADKVKLADSLRDAFSGSVIDVSTAGSGTIALVDVPSGASQTQRVYWHSHGLLGPLEDGAIALTNQRAYMARRPHRPAAIAYAVVATIDTGHVSVAMSPVMDR